MASAYKRILLKVSGEALAGDLSFGIEPPFLQAVAKQIADVARTGTQVAIVVGGGNIFRGMAGAADGTDRVTADLMGMLGTMINALALSNAISRQGVKSKPFSAATMPSVADTFTARDAKQALEEGFVVVLGGGTGNPFFTTDTAATLRAIELECDVVLKGTKVDGVYSEDPVKNPNATRYAHISYDDVISQNLKVMDTAAFALARDSRMPIIVYSLDDAVGLSGLLEGNGRFTLVGDAV
ncbi:MAG: UMP kinase [Devosia sp.]|jgi:uridylate kinase|uniref:UMP kinase n=1 Tax=unclassified Devosia TaxID=196773 RepID=UPI0019FCCFCB|nr:MULTISPECIES: UMP kinase [unclassified Devosia]MBF0678169.1 UMP kinase [Devosia sp.]WEJ31427.1 UMP kinase [Devosia sp. SD17-2]